MIDQVLVPHVSSLHLFSPLRHSRARAHTHTHARTHARTHSLTLSHTHKCSTHRQRDKRHILNHDSEKRNSTCQLEAWAAVLCDSPQNWYVYVYIYVCSFYLRMCIFGWIYMCLVDCYGQYRYTHACVNIHVYLCMYIYIIGMYTSLDTRAWIHQLCPILRMKALRIILGDFTNVIKEGLWWDAYLVYMNTCLYVYIHLYCLT